jgi:hypothetical protein
MQQLAYTNKHGTPVRSLKSPKLGLFSSLMSYTMQHLFIYLLRENGKCIKFCTRSTITTQLKETPDFQQLLGAHAQPIDPHHGIQRPRAYLYWRPGLHVHQDANPDQEECFICKKPYSDPEACTANRLQPCSRVIGEGCFQHWIACVPGLLEPPSAFYSRPACSG